jgi:hypothetical protein
VNSSLNLIFLAALAAPAFSQEPSLLDREPQGWTDIMPNAKLDGWTRLPIRPDPLAPASQWKRIGDLLVCEGDKGHDWLRFDKELADFVLHVEFRYTPLPGNPRYNSGIFVRTSADYEFWNQLQIGGGQGGYFFGVGPFDGRAQRYTTADRTGGEQRVKPAGEWNVVEITARGPLLSAWINGAAFLEYRYCPLLKGHIGLEGEGFRIEFRNLKLKILPPVQ